MECVYKKTEVAWKASPWKSWQVTLVRMLKAYEEVLARRGILASEDSHYYRLLLGLSLVPGPDWWSKFQSFCARNERSFSHILAPFASKGIHIILHVITQYTRFVSTPLGPGLICRAYIKSHIKLMSRLLTTLTHRNRKQC